MNKLSRRDFMKMINWVLGITGLSVLASPIIAYFWPKDLSETPAEPVSAGLEDDLGALDCAGALGDGLRHLLCLSAQRVIDDENLGHHTSPLRELPQSIEVEVLLSGRGLAHRPGRRPRE